MYWQEMARGVEKQAAPSIGRAVLDFEREAAEDKLLTIVLDKRRKRLETVQGAPFGLCAECTAG